MSKMRFLIPAVVVAAMLWGGVAQVQAGCPSPAPNCTTSGDVTLISGTYGCTQVITSSSRQVTTTLNQLDFDGAGTMDVSVQTSNNNSASGTTFVPWTNASLGTYCLNSNNTGYIFPTGKCPLPFIADSIDFTRTFYAELRIIDSTENLAATLICENLTPPID